MADSRKRWDTDDRFTGVADASAFALAVEELAALARRPGWVAEDPEIHLVPLLRGASVDGVRIVEIRTGHDGVLAEVAEVSMGHPLQGSCEVAGPDVFVLDELGKSTLAARGDHRAVLTDNGAGMFAAASGDDLIPGMAPSSPRTPTGSGLRMNPARSTAPKR